MPYANQDEKINKIMDRLSEIEGDVASIKGRPAIQGYAGKRLDLNDNLNVVSLKKQIADLSARITALEEA